MHTSKHAQKRVLIAEDEKPLARALALKLEGEGILVDSVHDGEAVTEKLKAGGYDLILLDLMMPRHDGFSVLEEMRARGDTTPVIVMTNLSQDSDRERVQRVGVIEYFVKGNTPLTDIVECVQQTLSH
jgi:DNA-binding response OmpR family regulator